jgi:hypothetical protein
VLAEIPGDTARRKLSPPIIMFALIRALAMAGTVAIAWGANLSHGYWMAIACIIALRPGLEQSTLYAAQRLAGALVGAGAAILLLLLIPANVHGLRLLSTIHGLEVVALVLLAHGGGDPLLELRRLLRGHRRGRADPARLAAAHQLRHRGLPGAVDVVRGGHRRDRHVPRWPARQEAAGQARRNQPGSQSGDGRGAPQPRDPAGQRDQARQGAAGGG